MKLQTRKVFGWSAFVTIAVILSVCHADQGTVTDEVTGKPIADAKIVVHWTGRVPMPVQSSEACFRLMATTSNVNGKFDIPTFSGNFNPLLQSRYRHVSVVARGYRVTAKTEYEKLLFSMRPLANPQSDSEKAAEDRRYLKDDNPGGLCTDTEKLKLPHLKVRYQNLGMLANSDADREALIGYLSYIDRIEFGDRIAEQNHTARILEFRKLKQNKDGQK